MSTVVRLAVSTLLSGGAVGPALGDGYVQITDGTGIYNGDNPGGAFVVNQNSGYNGRLGDLGLSGSTGTLGRGSFYTFCVESNEYLSLGSSYFTEIATSAMGGGVGGGSPDPLSETTALLYSTFRAGANFGAFGAIDSTAKTTSLQQAIWHAEGELASISGDALTLYNWANTNAVPGQFNGVRVLRLWTTLDNGVYSGNTQDVLTIIPLPPSALAGLGTLAGMLGLAVIRRRHLAVS